MADIINLQSVTKSFGGFVAVDDLTLAVGEGEFVTFLGPSGCGKTTTLRMIAGFEMPSRGRIYLAGEDVTDLPPYRRQVNTVFQDYALFPHMSIRDNVGYGLRVAGYSKADRGPMVEDALRTVGLLDKAEARPGNLSGGQKQRVALARALVRRPKVLLLDEPLSALDAKLREAMQVELKHLHQKLGITFVFVTHDQTEALIMSDRVIVMDRGRIVQAGSPAELYDHPASPYVANFIGTSNMLHGRIIRVDAKDLVFSFPGGEVRARPNGRAFAPGEPVVAAVRPEKIRLCGPDSPAPAGHTVLSGCVLEALFHGNSFRLEVDVQERAPFVVEIQLQTGAREAVIPVPGTRVELALNPETISVFPADEEPQPA
ncbi:MAG: spermidine/putrescine import ATP-binding protein PotA [Alphaproteobacteria bacterium]|nr:MAG: spermidine/putrescine import ATP-binding protein PotA [Alphaproteobacteria bacterium]